MAAYRLELTVPQRIASFVTALPMFSLDHPCRFLTFYLGPRLQYLPHLLLHWYYLVPPMWPLLESAFATIFLIADSKDVQEKLGCMHNIDKIALF